MSLRIKSLELRDFRNYEHCILPELGDLTLLVGPNAVGKTNILESLQLLTSTASFRNPKSDHLIRFGKNAASASMRLEGDGRKLDVSLNVIPGKRTYALNAKRKQPSQIRGVLPSVTFSPDDLTLVKGSHAQRRDVLDALGSQLSKNYHAVRMDYQKMLRQKNKLLKLEASRDYLASIDEVLASIGAQLFTMRSRLLQELLPHFRDSYAAISTNNEEASIGYVPSWLKAKDSDEALSDYPKFTKEQVREELYSAMQKRHDEEESRKLSLFGPHADHVNMFLDKKNAQQFASQGQQRSLVLALKLAEVSLIKERLGCLPVVLLDDVMSELDESRRSALLSVMDHGVQMFVTTTNIEYFSGEVLAKAHVIHLPQDAFLNQALDGVEALGMAGRQPSASDLEEGMS